MGDLLRLPTRASGSGLHVVVESPRGSRLKLKYDAELGVMTASRPLPSGLHYPYDWGFLPSTRAPDGDPLDAMIFWDISSFPGTVVVCRALGVLELEQDKKGGGGRERNDRLLMVPVTARALEPLQDVKDVAARQLEELERFFVDAVFFEPKNPRIIGWRGAGEAQALIDRCAWK